MYSLNEVNLIGNLTRDPEIKSMPGGLIVATISIATSEEYTTKGGEEKKEVEYHKVVLWKGLATIAGNHLSKGKKVYIKGKLKTRSWEQDGQKRYATDIIAKDLIILSQTGFQKPEQAEAQDDLSDLVSEIPF